MKQTTYYGLIIQELRKHPKIEVNTLSRFLGSSALRVACGFSLRYSRYHVTSSIGARMLLADQRCDVNMRDNRGSSPLQLAAPKCDHVDDQRYLDICKMLISHERHDIKSENALLDIVDHLRVTTDTCTSKKL